MNQDNACLAAVVAFELAHRNSEALQNWQVRKGLGVPCLDAYTPYFREALTGWFERKREIARRWLFKRRCERRGSAYVRGVDNHPIPLMLRKQGD